MPWKETRAMDQRVQFIGDWQKGTYKKVELCRVYGISRVTADKWIERYEAEGVEGLKERSRRPHGHPWTTSREVEERIVGMRLRHQSFGPKKVMDRLRAVEPGRRWPADSTAGEILKRAGLVKARERRRHIPPDPRALVESSGPGESWSADFKGDFRLGDGRRCYPLTITDNYSRYVLQCRGLSRTTTEAVKPWFEWVFREYGLPKTVRTDNGPPFASMAVGGISQLSKWWIRLGIRPERIRPASPSENGRHERMHRSLKAAAITPAAPSLGAQQRRFDAFVHEFNWQRSHEALDRCTPATVHQPSPRAFPAKLPEVHYDSTVTVRRVRHNGEFKWRGRLIYLSEVLAQEPIALLPVDNQRWEIRYSFHLLGTLDEPTLTVSPALQWHQR